MGNFTLKFLKETSLLFVMAMLCTLSTTTINAQPADPPWAPNADCESIVTDGIVAMTCGVLIQNPAATNYTFGMADLTGALPAAGRVDVTASVSMYHHPSWQVDSLGNVFGITMDNCGNTYTTASSQYSSAYFGQDGVIRYGDIGGGAEDLSAAGTIYKIDAMSGQASVFAVLPQQSYSFSNIPCEGGISYARNTGPGLGNIVFSFEYNTFYATNFEDGRIYRIDPDGNILDSYDPLTYDDGATGHPVFGDMPYGIDISNDNTELFFGTIGNNSINPRLYSIDLQADGSFPGAIDNTNLPTGATWDNYVDNEFEHYEFLPDGGFFFGMSFISDLEFTPSGNLLVGNRVGCQDNIHTSYNHGGRALVLEPDGGNIFNMETIIYVSDGVISDVNSYGGVSAYSPLAGGLDQFVISSADMLSEQGPHGICAQEEGVYGAPFGNPANPSAIISYLPGGIPFDVKGIGGDVHVFKECACSITCPIDIEGDDMYVCAGDTFGLSFTLIDGNAEMESTWTDSLGNVINPDSVVIDHDACAPGTYPFYVTAICLEDSTLTFTDTVIITAVTNDISPFVTPISDDCSVDVIIDPLCLDYLTLLDTIPIINPGDSGTVCINVVQTSPISCDTLEVCLDYDCPCDASCCPEAVIGTGLTVCSNDTFDLEFIIINGISEMSSLWTDEDGILINPNDISINHTACAPGDYLFYLTAVCEDDNSIVLFDTVTITVITDDISPFITTVEEPCEVDVIIDPDCVDYLEIIGTLPDIALGDSGTVCVMVVQTTAISCDTLEICLDYDCPCDASCCPTNTQTFPLTVCSGAPFDLLVDITGGISETTVLWTDENGILINPLNNTIDYNECAPGEFTYFVTAICEDDNSVVLNDSVVITVITDDISPFFTVIEAPCAIDVIIDPDCVDFLEVVGTIPDINPGESGTVNLQVVQTSLITCDLVDLTLNYDCPCDASCCPDEIITEPLLLCGGDLFDLEVQVIGGSSTVEISWIDFNGNSISPTDVVINHTDCAPGEYAYIVNVVCQGFPVTFTDTLIVTAITDDISPFVTLVEEDCFIDVIIDPDCAQYLSIDGVIPDIMPGDSGTVSIDIIQTTDVSCDIYTIDLSYDCDCTIDAVVVTEGECQQDGTFSVTVDVTATNNGDEFTVLDQNGNTVGTFSYSDVPITLGPYAGDTTTVYSFTLSDVADPECSAAFSFGPRACPICGMCEIPNAFTPDGDGMNDFFSIVCEGFADVVKFQIYNRWGQLVHDEVEPWDGRINGAPAPSDVYIYRIQFDTNCEVEVLEGDVTLVR